MYFSMTFESSAFVTKGVHVTDTIRSYVSLSHYCPYAKTHTKDFGGHLKPVLSNGSTILLCAAVLYVM